MTPTPPAPPSDALRLVLFGLPGSGKSALLGALGQVSQAHDNLLGGKIEDRGTLARAADDRPAGEVTAHPIHYTPGPAGGPSRDVEAVLVDSAGSAASSILTRQKGLDDDSPEGSLAYEVGDADALILVLDASTPAAQVEGQFAEFARFLETVQKARGARAEVAGMPVFLVLNKCDKLAERGDSLSGWMERIEQRKRDLAERFKAFLAGREGQKPPTHAPDEEPSEEEQIQEMQTYTGTFGRIELHVWATAVRKPDFGGRGESGEPYGVAELFRQALAEGGEYQERCARARRRLFFVSAASVALVAVMLAVTVGLFALHRNTQVTMLESRVRDFEFVNATGSRPGLRASVDQVRIKAARLEEIEANRYFAQLEPGVREKVERTRKEFADYIAIYDSLQSRRSPTSEQAEASLEESLKQLRAEQAALPEGWKDTPVAPLLGERIRAGEALQKAVGVARNWYLDSQEEADRLLRVDGTGLEWRKWSEQVEKLLGPANRPPFRPNEPIPGAPGTSLTYAVAVRFDTATRAREGWLDARKRLRRVFALTSALRLTTPQEFKAPALLDFPADFRLAAARPRLAQLKATYPEYEKEFIWDEVPRRLRPAVQKAARTQYERLLKVGRDEVLARYRLAGKGGEETPARWEAVRAWLKSPDELAAWRELALALLRLMTPSVEDPVTELAAFLGTKTFAIELDSITLEVPDRSDLRPRAGARLVILHPASMRQPALAFEDSGSEVRDEARGVVRYTFRRVGPKRLDFTPGDALWAELPLAGGKEKLVWSTSRSQLYLIDRLRNPPLRQGVTATAITEGKPQPDVRLIGKPEEGLPTVPDLLPAVTALE